MSRQEPALAAAASSFGAASQGPLRIAMVAARYFPFGGGIETHVHEVGRALASRGHAVTVLTADPTGRLPKRETVEGMEVRRVRSWPRRRDYCFAPGLFREVRRGAWDVVHVQGYHTFSAPIGMLGALASRVPFVLTFHSGGHSSPLRTSIRGLQQRLLAPLAARAAQLIGVSRFEAEHFSQAMGIPRSRFAIVQNGAQLPVAPVAAREGGPLVVSLGRLERYKGHHRALEAFAHLRRTRPEARLRLLGEGPYEEELRRRVRELSLDDSVEIGAIPAGDRSAMAALLASSSLVVLLSDYEAHPVAVMEALSLSRPVLTSDTSGFIELAEAGLVRSVPLGSEPQRIAQAMAEAIDAGAPATEVRLPNWADCTDRLLGIYREVVGRAAKAPDPDFAPALKPH